MLITSAVLKETALVLGADIVGIGDPELFEGTAKEKDPRYIFPGMKSVIGLGFRVLRGTLRGHEEGTQFFQYPEMSVVHLDEVYIPIVLRRVSCFLEDAGYEGVVLRSEPDRLKEADPSTNPEHTPVHRYSAVPVAEGRPAPDVVMDFRQGAVICGLGEMGYGGFVLTEEFGPLQRFGFILTDLELDFDDIRKTSLCDRCGECMSACPGKAYGGAPELNIGIGSSSFAYREAESWQCAAYYMGASGEKNPFISSKNMEGIPDRDRVLKGEKNLSPDEVLALKPPLEDAYPGMRFGYNSALCGRACWRACLVSLEKRGVLKTRFKMPFRTSEEWKLKL